MPWSLSQYGLYKKCPKAYEFRHKQKLPDPSGPAARRGTDIHAQLESYLATGNWAGNIPEFTRKEAEMMRSLGYTSEIKLALNSKWEPVEWTSPEAWVRGILDAMVVKTPKAMIGEWKTGKIYEVDHAAQRRLYLVLILSTYPAVDHALIETIYVDQSHAQGDQLERKNLASEQEYWRDAVGPMLRDTFFSPRPGDHCRWCNYSKTKGGPCVY